MRRYTGKPGRPPAVYGEHGIDHLGMDANVQDLRRAVRREPGSYRLYPVDSQGNELSPVACMELVSTESAELTRLEPAETDSAAATAAATVREVLELCKHMVKSRDEHDAMLTRVLGTLVTTTATIQRSTAMLLGAANTTIQVANGVEALERQEPPEKLDVDELSRQLAEALTPDDEDSEDSSSQQHWVMQLLSGPPGAMLFQFLNGFINSIAAAQQAKAAAAAAPGPAPSPTPPRAAPAPSTTAPASSARRNASPTPASASSRPSALNKPSASSKPSARTTARPDTRAMPAKDDPDDFDPGDSGPGPGDS